MDSTNPFPGAAELAYVKKKSKKQLKREAKALKKAQEKAKIGFIGSVKCTCGAWEQFFSTISYIHDDDCIINKKGKR